MPSWTKSIACLTVAVGRTALTKLAHLRQRVKRYRNLGKSLDKLHSPNLEKALTFLDDRLLPATSNAVERGNRRLRKMQKTVYRVRTQESLPGKLALDLQRDQHASERQEALATPMKIENDPRKYQLPCYSLTVPLQIDSYLTHR